jgi:hypothetical protein
MTPAAQRFAGGASVMHVNVKWFRETATTIRGRGAREGRENRVSKLVAWLVTLSPGCTTCATSGVH